MQMIITVGNGRMVKVFQAREDGPVYVNHTTGGENYKNYSISPTDFVALLNYYRNCKLGKESSEYIRPCEAEIALEEISAIGENSI